MVKISTHGLLGCSRGLDQPPHHHLERYLRHPASRLSQAGGVADEGRDLTSEAITAFAHEVAVVKIDGFESDAAEIRNRMRDAACNDIVIGCRALYDQTHGARHVRCPAPVDHGRETAELERVRLAAARSGSGSDSPTHDALGDELGRTSLGLV